MKRAVWSSVGVCVMCACCLGALLVAPAAATADLLPSSTADIGVPFTDGTVWTVATAPNGITYIGGDFTHVRLDTGSGVALAATSDAIDGRFPRVDGSVSATVPDGAGGFYIGGSFTKVGGISRNKIAHILANGDVDLAFNPFYANGSVSALALSGSTLYVGGDFTFIGPYRNHLAALDAATGAAMSWNPNPNLSSQPALTSIYALAVSGSTVYVGGYFDTIGGQTRHNIAALNATSGRATAWDPSAGGATYPYPYVYALAVSGSTVYAGGWFTTIGGQSRNYIAALDATSGLATAWNPDANGSVRAIAVSGSTVYAGGGFTSIGGQTRNNIAALDATSGAATAWDPNANSSVYALTVSGSTVYAGGYFTTIGGQARNYIAALDATSGLATAWDPNASSAVSDLSVSGSTIYVGGAFVSVGAVARNHLAALDANGAVTAWDPNANDAVWSLAVSGSTVYAGGLFTSIGGQTRNHVAALDATSGLATAWDPTANAGVWSFAVSGPTIYAAGEFTSIGGQSRNYIAALDATSGLATDWDPNAGGTDYPWVDAVAVSGSTVYAGGGFTSIGGQTRNNIAALDAASGAATAWDPNANSDVYALVVSGSTVCVGGYFTTIGGQSRNSIAALDATSGAATAWDPNANYFFDARSLSSGGDASLSGDSSSGFVAALAVSGSTVYAGGLFTSIGGEDRNSIAALDATSGLATAWDPSADYNAYPSVWALVVSGSTVYVAGDFGYIGGQLRQNLARFSLSQPPVYSHPHKRHPVRAKPGALPAAAHRTHTVDYGSTDNAGKGEKWGDLR